MTFPVFNRNRRVIYHRASILLAVALLLFGFAGGVTASSGSEHTTQETAGDEHGTEHAPAPAKGWLATDTYKVMNFVVLAVALVFFIGGKDSAGRGKG